VNDRELTESPSRATLRELGEVARENPRVAVAVLPNSRDRRSELGDLSSERLWEGTRTLSEAWEWVTNRARSGDIAVMVGPASDIALQGYARVRDDVCKHRLDLKFVALDAGLGATIDAMNGPVLDDVGLVRAIPNCSVFAPADAPSARAVLHAALAHAGPVYVRVPPGEWPTVTPGTFVPGKSGVLADGSDLTIAAYGPVLGQGIRAAGRLRAVGIQARVLDYASIKPVDEKATVRAARETGAILTIEDHTPLTGLGAVVTLTTAPEIPVPVRTLGIPDLFPEQRPGEGPWDAAGLGLDTIVDEAWELLRLRGKVQ
jgi:transketolase